MVAGLRAAFTPEATSRVLVGLDAVDDAAVYDLDGRTLVFTADYFPPVVDGAYDYGAVAASNALGDVFAMGGTPLLALNLAGFPDDMPEAVAAAILRGGADKVAEAGAVVAGGHTTRSEEPSYGLAVVGTVERDAIIRKGGARPGDVLVLSKPLGVGVITTAGKNGVAAPEELEAAVLSMKRLLGPVAAAARAAGVRCGTDVTGFGLIGHLLEMARASGVGFRIDTAAVPLLPGARRCAAEGQFPGGARNNEAFFGEDAPATSLVDGLLRRLLFVPETSGGLLVAVPQAALPGFLAACRGAGEAVAVIGEAVAGPPRVHLA
jgi:selenide,water dikinase